MTNAPTRRVRVEVEVTDEEWVLLATEAFEELGRTLKAVSEISEIAADAFGKMVKVWRELRQAS